MLYETSDLFEAIPLGEHRLYHSSFPVPEFNWGQERFAALWETHPTAYHTLRIHGREVETPRWQQSYGKNYEYSGSRNNALPITPELQVFLDWSQRHIDPRLNGLLLNWYDGRLNHYIGAHRDDTRSLQDESPIVTISLGQERIFRLRPYGGSGYHDLTVRNGEVVILPSDTNRHWTHEVPKFKRFTGKRISVTLRAYR